MATFDRWFGRLLGWIGAGVGIVIGLLAVVMTADVAMRNLGAGNLAWAVEISEYALFLTAFLGAPWALRQGAHIRMDLLILSLAPGPRVAVEILCDLLGLTVCAVMLWYGVAAARDAFITGTVIIKFLVVKEWWTLSVVPLAASLMAVEFGLRLARLATSGTVRGVERVGEP